MNLDELRQQINQVDTDLVELFTKRMNIALEVAQYKKANHLPALDRGRERDVLNRVTAECPEQFETYTKILFSTLFDLSRSYQNKHLLPESSLAAEIDKAIDQTPQLFPRKAVVACQGVEGAYSQLACDKLFSLPSIMYVSRFEGVFQAVESGLCQYGILPIENSSYGSVTEVYDLMKKYSFYIARSIKLQINHTLLTRGNKKLSNIREIFSHEQGLGQCSEFLKGLKDVKITVCENTAMAAKMVAESDREDIAAISSGNCAELYGLNVLSDSIQNSDSNYTRFICISKNMEIYPGANRISLMLSVPHQPGALYSMIAKFSALGLNLSKLQSRPIPGRDFEFMFYFDMDAPIYAPEVRQLLSELSSGPEQFVFLGSYSEI